METSAGIQRSTFVTVLAWIFIVLAGFNTFMSLLQNVMAHTMFPMDEMKSGFEQSGAQNIPAPHRFMMSNFRYILFGIFLLSVTVLASAVGLLKRKNWARLIFIVLMGMGIAWNIFSVVTMFFMDDFMHSSPGGEFETMVGIMKFFMFFMALGLSALIGWIIYKLSSSKIKAEFNV